MCNYSWDTRLYVENNSNFRRTSISMVEYIGDQQQNTNPENWPRRSEWNVFRALVGLRAGHASIPRHESLWLSALGRLKRKRFFLDTIITLRFDAFIFHNIFHFFLSTWWTLFPGHLSRSPEIGPEKISNSNWIVFRSSFVSLFLSISMDTWNVPIRIVFFFKTSQKSRHLSRRMTSTRLDQLFFHFHLTFSERRGNDNEWQISYSRLNTCFIQKPPDLNSLTN